jgi:hypothetical protein
MLHVCVEEEKQKKKQTTVQDLFAPLEAGGAPVEEKKDPAAEKEEKLAGMRRAHFHLMCFLYLYYRSPQTS